MVTKKEKEKEKGGGGGKRLERHDESHISDTTELQYDCIIQQQHASYHKSHMSKHVLINITYKMALSGLFPCGPCMCTSYNIYLHAI
jgi:hypothetical protein